MSATLRGIGIPSGVCVGRVRHGGRTTVAVVERELGFGAIAGEIARFRKALAAARKDLRRVRARIPRRTPAGIRSFIDADLSMMSDPALSDVVCARIESERRNAEWVLAAQRAALLGVFDGVEDPYLRARRDDVTHVVERLLVALAGPSDDDDDTEGVVFVAETLDAAAVLRLHQRGAAGFVTEGGGPNAHAAIVARGLSMPAVVGVHGARAALAVDALAALDSDTGTVEVDPDEDTLRTFRARHRAQLKARSELRAMREVPARTADGRPVTLLANIERPEDVRAVRAAGAAGVGLYRTEFLFLDRRSAPDEDEQLRAYLRVVRGMRGLPVTIRTLDLGAERVEPGHVAGENPALGLRAIRLGLRDPRWLLPQLRAILRAAATGPVEIMLPMVAAIEEVRRFRVLLERAARELDAAGITHADPVPVGVMIEVPGAALAAQRIAREVDFLSVGTNDLIQYTLAVDRADDTVDDLYDPLHPSVLKLIVGVLRAGNRAGIPVSLCGEMAGDTRFVRLLLGLGLTRFSMNAARMLEVKQVLTTTDATTARRFATRIVNAADTRRAYELLDALNSDA